MTKTASRKSPPPSLHPPMTWPAKPERGASRENSCANSNRINHNHPPHRRRRHQPDTASHRQPPAAKIRPLDKNYAQAAARNPQPRVSSPARPRCRLNRTGRSVENPSTSYQNCATPKPFGKPSSSAKSSAHPWPCAKIRSSQNIRKKTRGSPDLAPRPRPPYVVFFQNTPILSHTVPWAMPWE